MAAAAALCLGRSLGRVSAISTLRGAPSVTAGAGRCCTVRLPGASSVALATRRGTASRPAAGEGVVVTPRRAADEAEVEVYGRPGSKNARKAPPTPPVAPQPPVQPGGGAATAAGAANTAATAAAADRTGGGSRFGGSGRMPLPVLALGAASLLPIGFYVAQHAPLDSPAPPAGDAWVARAQAALPFDVSWAASGDQATVRTRYISYLATLTTFVGAVHWGFAAAAPLPRASHYLAAAVPAVAAWVGLCLPRDTLLPHALMSGTMFGLWAYEEHLVAVGRIPTWYPALRTPLTFALLAATTLCFGLVKHHPAPADADGSAPSGGSSGSPPQ